MRKKCKLVLCRHGKPSVSTRERFSYNCFNEWWLRYTDSLVSSCDAPLPELVSIASECSYFMSSMLPRAVDTAKKTLGHDNIEKNSLFNEVSLFLSMPFPSKVILSSSRWCFIARILWCMNIGNNFQETNREASDRVEKALIYLNSIFDTHDSVFLVSHSWFIKMMHERLLCHGWKCVDDRGCHYWMWKSYNKYLLV